MKTEQEWLEVYHDFWKIFGNNNVRLTLGQFEEVNRWGKIEVVSWDLRYSIDKMQIIIDLCKKHNLRLSLDNKYNEINLYENYEEDVSEDRKVTNG